MDLGRWGLVGLASALAFGGIVAVAASDNSTPRDAPPIEMRDDDGVLRRNEVGDDLVNFVDDDDDDPDATGDGDNTAGDDGTNGGDNTALSRDDASQSRDGASVSNG